MNIYKALNEITKYIDDNLEEKIDYEVLAKMLGVNVYTMQKLFSMISGVPLSEYIRKRRLSNAGFDLYSGGSKVMDIAIKYQYDNATSFSRAFQAFHGIKPSLVNKSTKLKNFPRIVFNEDIKLTDELEYEIVNLESMDLYGLGFDTNNEQIGKEAPLFFKEMERKYRDKYGEVKYGMVTYDEERMQSQQYYCLYDEVIDEFDHIFIPGGRWLLFRINSQDPKDIQEMSHKFYLEFLPSCRYNLREVPELEYYHNGITDFLVPIY